MSIEILGVHDVYIKQLIYLFLHYNYTLYPTEAIHQRNKVLYSSYYSVITDSYYTEKH